MEIKKVASFGIIPVRKLGDSIEVLVIHMYGSAGGTHWSFPKGRPEGGETPLESALRECSEEVGLTPAAVFTDDPISEHYTFIHEGIQIEKTVTYFVGMVEIGEIAIQVSEIKEAVWLPPSLVSDRLTYPAAQAVFAEAIQLLKREGLC